MLTTLHVANFKSLGPNTEPLTLRPITVLVGANSSGKSSVIQTLLLLKQTFQYGGTDRPVLLNGPLLRLGNFYDVKNALSPSRSFRLGFEIKVTERPEKEGRVSRSVLRGSQVTGVACDVMFGLDAGRSADEISLLQPFLRRSLTTVFFREGDRVEYRTVWVNRARRHSDDVWAGVRDKSETQQLTDLRLQHLSQELTDEIYENRPDARIHGAYSTYMVPTKFLVSYNEAEQQADLATAQIINPYSVAIGGLTTISLSSDLLDPIKEEVLSWLAGFVGADDLISVVQHASNIAEMAHAILSLTTVSSPALSRAVTQRRGVLQVASLASRELSAAGRLLQDRVRARVLAEVGDEPGIDAVAPGILQRGAQTLQDYFIKRVKYLGPLREAPKPLYPLEALSDPTDVGYRGEHTAAVLDLNKNARVIYVPPPSSDQWRVRKRVGSLQSAVVEWLVYMDLVSGIATGDRGKFGRELQVALPDIPKFHDLTNVGVGVSQVLPIIVLALLAPEDSTIILEQPELHLHPKVQTRLGDFLLSLVELNKQCVIETHSEHLIYRLRRRVAETDEAISDTIGLYFVDRIKGETKIRRVEINKFGALSEWPRGFFDQSQLEAEQIVRAAAKKQSSKP